MPFVIIFIVTPIYDLFCAPLKNSRANANFIESLSPINFSLNIYTTYDWIGFRIFYFVMLLMLLL